MSWYIGGKLTRPSHRLIGAVPEGLNGQAVHFPSESGADIAGWHFDTPGASTTAILLHPLHGDRRAMLMRARFLIDAGYAALVIDLQAHGESHAEAVTFGYLEALDAQAAVAFARAKAPAHRLVGIGWSLGGAAFLLAEDLALDAVVLEAVYPTIKRALHNRLEMRLGPLATLAAPVLSLQLPLRVGIGTDALRPIDHIAKIGCPVLVLGGTADEHTTEAETRALFDAAVEPKELLLFEGVEHADFFAADQELYEREVLSFLSR